MLQWDSNHFLMFTIPLKYLNICSGIVKCSPEAKLAQNLAVVEGKVFLDWDTCM